MEEKYITGFHHMGLRCSNIDQSLTMYKALGLQEIMRWGTEEKLVVMLDIGDGGRIEMFADGSDAYSPNGKWIHIALKVTDVDAVYQKALDIGFTPKMEPTVVPLATQPEPTPIHIAFVHGPDGEQVEFFKEV